jgi:hypothetical protein
VLLAYAPEIVNVAEVPAVSDVGLTVNTSSGVVTIVHPPWVVPPTLNSMLTAVL